MPKLEAVHDGKDGTLIGYYFFCPGCQTLHGPMVAHSQGYQGPKWTFNGDLEKPTFSPSILVYAHATGPRCHSFVRNGQIQFLTDCGHELAGKTVDLPELPEWAQ